MKPSSFGGICMRMKSLSVILLLGNCFFVACSTTSPAEIGAALRPASQTYPDSWGQMLQVGGSGAGLCWEDVGSGFAIQRKPCDGTNVHQFFQYQASGVINTWEGECVDD